MVGAYEKPYSTEYGFFAYGLHLHRVVKINLIFADNLVG